MGLFDHWLEDWSCDEPKEDKAKILQEIKDGEGYIIEVYNSVNGNAARLLKDLLEKQFPKNKFIIVTQGIIKTINKE